MNVIFYVSPVSRGSVLGVFRSRDNAMGAPAPVLAAGIPCALKLRLFAAPGDAAPFTLADLADVTDWSFELDNDYDSATTVKLVADNADITAATVEDGGDTFAEFTIPISAMLTEELAAVLAVKPRITLTGELVGRDDNGKALFVLQVKNFVIRNRISDAAAPTPIPTRSYAEIAEAAVSGAILSSGLATSADAGRIASGVVLSGGYLKAPVEVVDHAPLEVVIPVLSGGTVYRCDRPLVRLTVENVPYSLNEAVVVFDALDPAPDVRIGAGIKADVGELIFNGATSYALVVAAGCAGVLPLVPKAPDCEPIPGERGVFWDGESSAMTVKNATVANGDMTVFSGGVADVVEVAAPYHVHVRGDGVVRNVRFADAQALYVSSGGMADRVTLENAASATVSSGGFLYSCSVIAGKLVVSGGGRAERVVLTGALTTAARPIASALSGGTVSGVAGTPGYAEFTLRNGAICSGGDFRHRNYVNVSGALYDAVASSGAVLRVSNGGVISHVTVLSGGSVVAYPGGTVREIVAEDGAVCVKSGGVIER